MFLSIHVYGHMFTCADHPRGAATPGASDLFSEWE